MVLLAFLILFDNHYIISCNVFDGIYFFKKAPTDEEIKDPKKVVGVLEKGK